MYTAQESWLLWADTSANQTTLDTEAGRKDVPAAPVCGAVTSGVFRPKREHNAAFVQFFSAGGDNEICEFEVLGYPLPDSNGLARGSVIAKAEVVLGTQNTGAILTNPITGGAESSTTWREADTLRNQDASALDVASPLEFILFSGFNADDKGGLIYLNLRAWTYYAIRLTALPSGPDRTIVGLLPFTEE